MKKILFLLLFSMASVVWAVDNFVRGEVFDGETGLKTGAQLEDLVTEATWALGVVNTANTSRLFDSTQFELTTDATGDAGTNVISVKTGGITTTEILNGTITSADLASGVAERQVTILTKSSSQRLTNQSFDTINWNTAQDDDWGGAFPSAFSNAIELSSLVPHRVWCNFYLHSLTGPSQGDDRWVEILHFNGTTTNRLAADSALDWDVTTAAKHYAGTISTIVTPTTTNDYVYVVGYYQDGASVTNYFRPDYANWFNPGGISGGKTYFGAERITP